MIMSHLFVVACLGLLLLAQLEAAAQSCSAINNCADCHSSSDCKWCGQHADIKYKGEQQFLGYLVGACVEKTAGDCNAIQFGTLADLTNFDYATFGAVAVTTVKEFELLPNTTTPFHSGCTSFEFPSSFQQKTCPDCLALGSDYGFCQIDLRVGSIAITSGGVCIHKSLGALCDSTIAPYKLPDPLSSVSYNLYYATEDRHCSNFEKVRPYKQTERKCEDNKSCYTCKRSAGDCTWCGGEVQLEAMGGNVLADVFGKCITGANMDCAYYANFGSLPSLAKTLGGTFRSVELQKEDTARCGTVRWSPAFAEPDCQHCVTDASRKWCHIDTTLPNEPISAGMCLDVANDFVCTMQFAGDAKVPSIASNLHVTTASCNSIDKTTTTTLGPKPTPKPTPTTQTTTEEGTTSTTSGTGPAPLTASLTVVTLIMATAILL